MAKNNRTCRVCQTAYNFCPTCERVPASEKYRTMFCTKNCYDVFYTISRYFVKDVTKDEAKEILSSLDLSKQAQFSEQIKTDMDEIMGINKKPFKKKVAEEPVVTEAPVAIDVTTPTEI